MSKFFSRTLDDDEENEFRVDLKKSKGAGTDSRGLSSALKKIKHAVRQSHGGGKAGSKGRYTNTGRGNTKAGGKSAAATSGAKPLQRVAVRWSFSRNKGTGAWGAHGRYLERESAQRDKERGQGFNASEDGVKISETLGAWEKAGDAHLFKIILSPEFGDKLDLQQQTRALMLQMEKDLGTKLEYVADAHFNTDDPHVHIAIRGVDEHGKTLEISPEYIKAGSRTRAQEIATQVLGYRTEKDIAEAAERQISQQRFTEIDRVLLDSANDIGTPNLERALVLTANRRGGDPLEVNFDDDDLPLNGRERERRLAQIEYLVVLERKGLAHRIGDMSWKLSTTVAEKSGIPVTPLTTDQSLVHLARKQSGQKMEISFADKPPEDPFLRQQRLEQITRLGDLERAGQVKRVSDMCWHLDPAFIKENKIQRQSVQIEGEKVIDFSDALPKDENKRQQRLVQIRRLNQLEKMGLAQQIEPKVWKLAPHMESALRQMQMSSDRLKTKHRHLEMISDPSLPLVSPDLRVIGTRIAGKVIATGLDDRTHKPYLLVEGFDNRIHYLPQHSRIENLRGRGELQVGGYVSIEVAQKKDRSGRPDGQTVRVKTFENLTPELLDYEILAGAKSVTPIETQRTVAGEFRREAAKRIEVLRNAGAIEIEDGMVRQGSKLAHDRVTFVDRGHDAAEYDGRPMVATVLAKGRESVLVRDQHGKSVALRFEDLQKRGMESRYVTESATLFVGQDMTDKGMATILKTEQLVEMQESRSITKIDLVARQVAGIEKHPFGEIVEQRKQVWKDRSIDINGPEFQQQVASWNAAGFERQMEDRSKLVRKPIVALALTTGNGTVGRVIGVSRDDKGTTVMIESDKEIHQLRQPIGEKVALRIGQFTKAKADKTKWSFGKDITETGREINR